MSNTARQMGHFITSGIFFSSGKIEFSSFNLDKVSNKYTEKHFLAVFTVAGSKALLINS